MIPIPLRNYFEVRTTNNHRYNLRRRQEIIQPMIYRTTYALKSLQYKSPYIWNEIPQNLQECETLTKFKKQLKAHLLLIHIAEE